jgi:hypothetical protein
MPIICLLELLKNNFFQGDEAVFLCVERLWEIFFCIVGIEKMTFTRSQSYVLSRRMAMRNHNLNSGRLKKQLCRSR